MTHHFLWSRGGYLTSAIVLLISFSVSVIDMIIFGCVIKQFNPLARRTIATVYDAHTKAEAALFMVLDRQ